jgi:rod shape-determining protein MreC
MPLGTLDDTPPSFYRQGPSALSKLIIFSALALFLMALDARLGLAHPIRTGLSVVLYPIQWLAIQPILLVRSGTLYLESLGAGQGPENALRQKIELLAQRANQLDALALENTRLRNLLGLRDRISTSGQSAQVLYDAADPYTRKVIIDQGSLSGIVAGSPVVDETGVLGQVTRVYPALSEVTLITDREQAIPVLNTRTGARGVAFGDAAMRSNTLELRFMSTNADVLPGDILSTSGVDGVYPPGLPVAKVDKIERRVDSPFARISCTPLALVAGVGHVLVLKPVSDQIAARPEPDTPAETAKKEPKK